MCDLVTTIEAGQVFLNEEDIKQEPQEWTTQHPGEAFQDIIMNETTPAQLQTDYIYDGPVIQVVESFGSSNCSSILSHSAIEEPKIKRKRGRPRKIRPDGEEQPVKKIKRPVKNFDIVEVTGWTTDGEDSRENGKIVEYFKNGKRRKKAKMIKPKKIQTNGPKPYQILTNGAKPKGKRGRPKKVIPETHSLNQIQHQENNIPNSKENGIPQNTTQNEVFTCSTVRHDIIRGPTLSLLNATNSTNNVYWENNQSLLDSDDYCSPALKTGSAKISATPLIQGKVKKKPGRPKKAVPVKLKLKANIERDSSNCDPVTNIIDNNEQSHKSEGIITNGVPVKRKRGRPNKIKKPSLCSSTLTKINLKKITIDLKKVDKNITCNNLSSHGLATIESDGQKTFLPSNIVWKVSDKPAQLVNLSLSKENGVPKPGLQIKKRPGRPKKIKRIHYKKLLQKDVQEKAPIINSISMAGQSEKMIPIKSDNPATESDHDEPPAQSAEQSEEMVPIKPKAIGPKKHKTESIVNAPNPYVDLGMPTKFTVQVACLDGRPFHPQVWLRVLKKLHDFKQCQFGAKDTKDRFRFRCHDTNDGFGIIESATVDMRDWWIKLLDLITVNGEKYIGTAQNKNMVKTINVVKKQPEEKF